METITISTKNSKLGQTIPTINLPPVLTCRENAPCRKGCYACKGNFVYSTVQKSMQKNLRIYQNDAKSYFNQIQGYLIGLPYKLFRYHSAGDIVDTQYLQLMCETAKKCKKTQFLCFTKKYELVNEYIKTKHKIPKNLVIVFSAWANFIPENPYNLPMTYVNFNKDGIDKNIPKQAKKCKGNCETCQMCWKLKNGQSIYFNKH